MAVEPKVVCSEMKKNDFCVYVVQALFSDVPKSLAWGLQIKTPLKFTIYSPILSSTKPVFLFNK
jgi:hypothetical protein